MEFEYDPDKSVSNLEKHGIDFEDAQTLWLDPLLIEVEAKTTDEKRYVVIGRIDQKHWTGIINYRNEKIRIISVRRSRKKEIEIYES